MERTPLLPLPEGMFISQIQERETSLLIEVIATQETACCPLCSQASSSVHSHYYRTVADVPCGGRQIQLALTVRKFFCRNPLCARKVFTERLATLVEPWARMTIRLTKALQSIGLATCGKGGSRLAARLAMRSTRQTILRRIMDLPSLPKVLVQLLGIDDFSFRRGFRFGTILVNLETHRIIDLLPDRLSDTSADWMKLHPEITVVSRDGSSTYASAASEGAPQALQCSDRFHLCKNLTEATQLLLARSLAEILVVSQTENEPGLDEPMKRQISIQEWQPPEPASAKKARLARRSGRYARYAQVIQLREQGMKPKEIAQRLALSDRTVQRWLTSEGFPEAKKRRKRQSCFDDFAPYVLKRWQEGEHRGAVLRREIMEQGYTGSGPTVYRYLDTLKQAEVKAPANLDRIQKFSANAAVWLFIRDPKTLDEIEQADLSAFCEASSALKRAYDLVQDFFTMVRKRQGHRLDTWLAQVAKSDLPELQSFACGVEKDKAAVHVGLTRSTNNAQVEGQVTKLKLIKRTMYGRAGFPLLRQRVLHAF
jgi:transposase